MKNATEHARKLAALLKRLGAPTEPSPLEDASPLARLVVGFLQWNASQRAAHLGFKKLMSVMVDYNDLRVSRPSDIVGILGPRYPQGEERTARLRDTLQALYVREHATSLEPLRGKSAREVRAYLESLPGITPYVTAYTLLWGFDQATLPLDERLVELLKQQQIAESEATLDEVAGFLERNIKGEAIRQAHLALQEWADQQPAAAASRPTPARKAATRMTPTRSQGASGRKPVKAAKAAPKASPRTKKKS